MCEACPEMVNHNDHVAPCFLAHEVSPFAKSMPACTCGAKTDKTPEPASGRLTKEVVIPPELMERARHLLEKATPGPWKVMNEQTAGTTRTDPYVGMKWNEKGWWDADSTILTEADAELIAWCRNNLPDLLAALEASEQERKRLSYKYDRRDRAFLDLLESSSAAGLESSRLLKLAYPYVLDALHSEEAPGVRAIVEADLQQLSEALRTRRWNTETNGWDEVPYPEPDAALSPTTPEENNDEAL